MKTREQIRMQLWERAFFDNANIIEIDYEKCAIGADRILAEFDKRFPEGKVTYIGNCVEQPTETPAPEPLPEGVPPLPDGAVYLGLGGRFDAAPANDLFYGWSYDPTCGERWNFDGWRGNSQIAHYAAPSGSEIAKLNGK